MTDKEILTKAIERVYKNGLKEICGFDICHKKDIKNFMWWVFESQDQSYSIEEIIFNHDFAKAFWGEEDLECVECYNNRNNYWCCHDVCISDMRISKKWQYHLYQMVIEKESLKYIEKFLEDK